MGQLFNKSTNNFGYIKSLNINAHPCSRRRSTLVENSGKNESYYIPYDPEARLNTESNNRKHTGLNGYIGSYLKEFDISGTGSISLVLDGYLFTINADNPDPIVLEDLITSDLATKISLVNKDKIYANIRLEEIQLYADDNKLDYKTWVLRDQTQEKLPQTSLDCFTSTPGAKIDNSADYYFSGLSFSAEPLTGNEVEIASETFDSYTADGKRHNQKIVSLCIFEKDENDTWQICQRALLPNIKHGTQSDSIVVPGNIKSDTINTVSIDASGDISSNTNISAKKGIYYGEDRHALIMLDVIPDTSDPNNKDCYLKFTKTEPEQTDSNS